MNTQLTIDGSCAASLPSLLGHLDLSSPFALALDSQQLSPQRLAIAFPPLSSIIHTQPSPFTQHSPWLTSTPTPGSLPLAPLPPAHLKRLPPVSPHLLERTKQRKLSHRFFRSDSLLSPPAPATRPPPTTERPAFLQNRSLSDDVVSATLRPQGYTISAKRKLPAWWASVSRSFGDGLPSRLAPRENVWVGEGEAWLPGKRLEDSPASSAKQGSTTPTQSLSQQPQTSSEPRAHEETAGAIKRQLLAILRLRMSDAGGSGRIGEAGLRFKKWVIWNRFAKRQEQHAVLAAPVAAPVSVEPELARSAEVVVEVEREGPASEDEAGFPEMEQNAELDAELEALLEPYLHPLLCHVLAGEGCAMEQAQEIVCEA